MPAKVFWPLVMVLFVAVACAKAAPTPTPPLVVATSTPTSPATATPRPVATPTPPAAPLVNAWGVKMPADAAPLAQQFLRGAYSAEGETNEFAVSVYNRSVGFTMSPSLAVINKNFEMEPFGAESWSVSPDGLTWTFKIDKDLNWSDGKPLSASDYEWSFRYMADPKHAYDFSWYWGFSINPKNWEKVNGGKLPLEELGVKALDTKTLQITTEVPAPYMDKALVFSAPLAKHQVEKFGVYYANDPKTAISSMPWILTEWKKSERIVFEPNRNYAGKRKPFIEKFIFVFGTRSFESYLVDEIDSVSSIAGPDYEFMVKRADLKPQVHLNPGDFRSDYVFFDYKTSPFDNVKVRQAIARAIDREAIVSKIWQVGFPAYGFLAPGYPDAVPPDELKKIQGYDPVLAKKLLAEAGYPDGKGFPKVVFKLRATSGPEALRLATGVAIGDMLKKNLNIDVEVALTEVKIFMDELGKDKIPIGLIDYGMDYFDASNLLSVFKGGGRHNWDNADYDKLLALAGPEQDQKKRHDLYVKAQELLSSEGAVWLFHRAVIQLIKPYVVGEAVTPNKYGQSGFQWPGVEAGFSSNNYTIYISKDAQKHPGRPK